MNAERTQVIQQCVKGSLNGDLNFSEIVGRLIKIGVERYHRDYSRLEITYYFPDGDSLVVESPHEDHPTGTEFSAAAVESAVRQNQRGEHSYPEFVRKTMAAGCVGYFVQLTGRRALYFGRRGEIHVEHFPNSTAD